MQAKGIPVDFVSDCVIKDFLVLYLMRYSGDQMFSDLSMSSFFTNFPINTGED